jgi:putative addiction module component (TIGR02574 family)
MLRFPSSPRQGFASGHHSCPKNSRRRWGGWLEEKIDYVQLLWDCITVDESKIPVPDWHRELLNERLADYRANPNEGRPWEEVEADLLKHGRR